MGAVVSCVSSSLPFTLHLTRVNAKGWPLDTLNQSTVQLSTLKDSPHALDQPPAQLSAIKDSFPQVLDKPSAQPPAIKDSLPQVLNQPPAQLPAIKTHLLLSTNLLHNHRLSKTSQTHHLQQKQS